MTDSPLVHIVIRVERRHVGTETETKKKLIFFGGKVGVIGLKFPTAYVSAHDIFQRVQYRLQEKVRRVNAVRNASS